MVSHKWLFCQIKLNIYTCQAKACVTVFSALQPNPRVFLANIIERDFQVFISFFYTLFEATFRQVSEK